MSRILANTLELPLEEHHQARRKDLATKAVCVHPNCLLRRMPKNIRHSAMLGNFNPSAPYFVFTALEAPRSGQDILRKYILNLCRGAKRVLVHTRHECKPAKQPDTPWELYPRVRS